MRPCDVFLQQRRILLGECGYEADSTQVELNSKGWFVFYHYTHEQNLNKISDTGGLYARLPVVNAKHIPELNGCCLIEGLLQPLPIWITANKYFSDFCFEMVLNYVGDFLLRITIPPDFPGVYVADMAHNFDCKHQQRRGHSVLNLGYDCLTGKEVTMAEANSYIPIGEYRGGHILPNVKATRCGEGIVIPNQYISVCETQPLRER
ncbi:MAG: hypothetical protein HY740_00725 [Chloroflexi bacterium]|nr:hypothetical protein [Chloroflexota bacterium]